MNYEEEDDDDDDVLGRAWVGWRQSRSWSILVSVGKLISVIRVISIIYPRVRAATLLLGAQTIWSIRS